MPRATKFEKTNEDRNKNLEKQKDLNKDRDKICHTMGSFGPLVDSSDKEEITFVDAATANDNINNNNNID